MSEFSVEECLQQGQVLLGAEKYEEAIDRFDKVLEKDERNVDAYISKGIALAYLERLDEAEKSLRRAVTVKKDSADAYFHLGNVTFMRDDIQGGIENMNLAIANGYSGADAYYILGLLNEQSEDYLQALRNYSKAIRIDELNPMYRIKKSVLEFSLGDYESAAETAAGIRKYCPDQYEGYHLGAAALTMLKRHQEAKDILHTAIVSFPEDNDITLDLVRVALAEDDYAQAKQLLGEVEKNDPTDDELKETYLNFGKISLAEGDATEGEQYLLRSLQTGAFGIKDTETQFVLVNLYNATKQYEKMLDMALEMAKVESHESYALSGTYFAALAKKNMLKADYKEAYKEAIRFYRQLTLREPSRVDGYVYRAMCHRDLEEYDKAVECLDYVLLLSPESKELHLLKSEILKETGKEKEAQQELEISKNLRGTGIPGLFGGE